MSGRRFVYKFVPSPEIYAAVNAIKAHMIRNGVQQIPLGPFPHYRQSDSIPTTPQDTKPFMYYPHIRPRSISPRTETDLNTYPPRPSPPRSRSPNCYRSEERYKTNIQMMFGRSYQNDELVRKMKYFEQEDVKYSSTTERFTSRRHHSENEYHRDENRATHHQRLTPPIESSQHENRHLQSKYFSPSYEYKTNDATADRKPDTAHLNSTSEKPSDQLPRDYYHNNGGVLRETENHHEERKPSAFISLESRRMNKFDYPPPATNPVVKSEPQSQPPSSGYCKDCPSCNVQPAVSECQRNPRRFENHTGHHHHHHNGYHQNNNRSPSGRDSAGYYYRRHVDSTSSDDVFYQRKYVPMVDASTQTDRSGSSSDGEKVSSPKREYFNDERERERERSASSWVDLNMTSDLRMNRATNGHIATPKSLSPSHYSNNNNNNVLSNNNGAKSPTVVISDKNNNINTNGNHIIKENNEIRKSYSPDELLNGNENISRISTPSSITSPPTPVSTPVMCKCGCMDSVGSPALPTTNGGTVVVYPKEVL